MLITSYKEFQEIINIIQKVFDTKQKLPHQVFKVGFKCFIFEEFEWVEDPEFWDIAIKELVGLFDDKEIIIMAPDLYDYYRKFDTYPAFKIPSTSTGKDYRNALYSAPKASPNSTFYICADTIILMPTSCKWAIWGERSYSICVLGFAKDSMMQISQESGWWRSASEALDELVKNCFLNSPEAFEEFSEILLKNYSNA